MNVQPKPSPDAHPMPAFLEEHEQRPMESAPRVPAGPRAFVTWPVEFEVEPWRP